MIAAPPLPDEGARLAALHRYQVLDTPPEKALDELTSLAAQICDVPIALISLVDKERQWFKSKVGFSLTETKRNLSFCGHALKDRRVMEIADATRDERFADNPLVTGQPHIRFYAGSPLITPDNQALGTLCVIDRVPRQLTKNQEQALQTLARQAMTHLELRRYMQELLESEERLRIVTDNAGVGLVMLDRDRRYVYANSAYAEILGLSSVPIVGRRVDEVLPDIYEDQIRPRLDRALAGERFSYELHKSTAGRGSHYLVRYEPTMKAGEVAMVVVVIVDITAQKQAATAPLRLAAIVQSSDDAIIGKDLNGIVTSWNRGAEKIFGYTEEEMAGTSITRLIPTDRLEEEEQILGRIRRGESMEHFETLRRRKDGRLINVSVTASPIKDEAGLPIGVSKIARDITERKHAEEQLLWKTAFFEAQVNSALDGMMVVDREGKTILQNQRMVELWKMPPEIASEEDQGLRLEWVTGQVKNPAEFAAKVSYLYSHPGDVSRDEIELADGRVFDRYSAPVLGPEGKYYGRIWAFRDVTERKRDQERIAEQAALLDKTHDAVLVRDLEGNLLFWNQGAERMYGYTRDEVIGRNVGVLLYTDPKKFTEPNRRAISEGEWTGELQHLTKGRGEITVECRWTLVRDNEGRPKSVLAINTDITERKKIEAQFMRAQRMESIGTLAGGVAHDLNNILAPIMMSIDVLKPLSSDPRAVKILDTIEVSAKRGADIVRQVLSFARGLEGQRIEVQPKHLVRDLESIVKDTFPKDIRLQFTVPADTWTILGDPTQIHQILLNLCVNARDAMPHGGSLSVSVQNSVLDDQYAAMNIQAKPGRYVNISVTDSGTGMPADLIDKIFEPFFTTKDLTKGTGLGLSTVMAIVKSHDGIINVYSEPGHGTTFQIYLPTIEAAEGQTERQEEAEMPRGSGETVLVIDDEASILTITGQTLAAFGYRVLTAIDGADALSVYVQHREEIALVLTDMMMPVMDGPATIHALLRINPAVRIIAASGLNANGGVARAAGVGVKHFLTKPYTASAMLKMLRDVLDEPERQP